MTKFEVGQPFPLHNHARGIEETRISFNESFFDIFFYLKRAGTEDIKTFRKGPLKYGVFESQNIPFFILELGSNWTVDTSLNILKVKEDKIEQWLNSEANAITMYCIDADTNIILGMRLIGILPTVAEKIRDVLDEQLNMYNTRTANEVEAVINKILDNFTTEQMISRTKMIKL